MPGGSETGSWLMKDGLVLSSLEIADTGRSRARGLIGREGIEGALLLRRCRSVHTFGMRFPIDVAFCDRDGVVLRVATVPVRRVTRFVWRAEVAVEAEAGAFARWGVLVGDHLEFG